MCVCLSVCLRARVCFSEHPHPHPPTPPTDRQTDRPTVVSQSQHARAATYPPTHPETDRPSVVSCCIARTMDAPERSEGTAPLRATRSQKGWPPLGTFLSCSAHVSSCTKPSALLLEGSLEVVVVVVEEEGLTCLWGRGGGV